MNATNNNKFFVIVQFDTKHFSYGLKRNLIMSYVRKRKGVCLSPGVFVMPTIDIKTQRERIIEDFVKAGMLDEGDRVICIEAANWTTYPHPYRRRSQQPQFPQHETEIAEASL